MFKYGNENWNKATCSNSKAVIPLKASTFERFQPIFEEKGLNYYAYSHSKGIVMAVDKKDINALKQIVGYPLADKLKFYKPAKEYNPPDMNVIGNTDFKQISNKRMFKVKESDVALKMADLLEKESVVFSGRVYNDHTTFTVTQSDFRKLEEVYKKTIHIRSELFGNHVKQQDFSYDQTLQLQNANKKHNIYLPISKLNSFKELESYLKRLGLDYYSIEINDKQLIVTVDKEKARDFYKNFDLAIALCNCEKKLSDSGFSENQIKMLQPIISVCAEKDFDIISNFANPNYTDKHNTEIMNLLLKHIDRAAYDRMIDKNGYLKDLLNRKKSIDTEYALAGFFSEHDDFSDEQKDALKSAYIKYDLSVDSLNMMELDNSYSVAEINDIFSAAYENFDYDKVEMIKNKHKENQSELLKIDFIDFAADYIKDNEKVKNAYANSDRQNYLLEVNNAVDGLLTELISDKVQMPAHSFFEVSNFYDRFFYFKSISSSVYSAVADSVSDILNKAYELNVSTSVEPEEPVTKEKSFSEQVDEVLNGTFPFYTNLKVCDTPKILIDVGCEQLPMLYTQRHLKNAIKPIDSKNHHHGLTVEQIKSLPELLSDPVMIFDSPNKKDSIIIVTSESDVANNPIIASIKPNGKGRYEIEDISSNFITSVYGRNNFSQYIKRIIDSDNLLFCNKTKSQELFERWGEQYSELTNNLDFNSIIHQSRNIVKAFNEEKIPKKEQNSPEKTFDDNDFKEKNVTLMSDADEISDVSYQKDDIKSIKLDFFWDSSSLGEIKNMALSLGATITMDNENGILSVDTYNNHKDELLNKAYELNISTSTEQEEPVTKEKSFSEQVDDVLNGKANRYNDLKVCDTPKILQDVGLNQLPMYYTKKHLRDALKPKGYTGESIHYHGLDKEQIQKMPDLLNNPIMIYDSLSRNDSIIVVTSEVDKDNMPIIAAIKPDGKAKYDLELVDSNFILSFHGRNNFENQINKAIEQDKILYVDKQKSQELFSVLGLQLSKGLNSFDFNNIIHQSRNIVKAFNEEKIAENEQNSFEKTSATDLHAAFEKMYKNHIFSDQAKQLLERTEKQMKINELYDKMPENPYFTKEQIDDYAKKMLAIKNGEVEKPVPYTTPEKQAPEKPDTTLPIEKETTPSAVNENTTISSTSDEQLSLFENTYDNIQVSLKPKNTQRQNFTINDDSLGEGGAKAKYNANINAIQTLQKIEAENRTATPEEQEILSKYVGWGGLANAFDESKSDWANEYAQLKDLLTEKEYSSARASTLDSFYTAPAVIDGIYNALEQFGFKGGNVLEPAMGIGNFFGRMPADMQKNSNLYGVEIDSISGRIAQKLYPNADIAVQGFEKNKFQNCCFDVAVGNVPFGELAFKDNKHGTTKLHDYFFAETLDKVKDGGIVAFVTSAGTLDKRDESTRLTLSDKTDFIGAIRLPGGKNGAFKDNAGTEVTTDIIFLKKNNHKSVAEMSDIPDWVHIGETADGLPINKYFAENPDMVLGTVIEGNKLYGSGTMVIADDSTDLKEQIQNAVSKLSANISKEPAREVYAKIDNQTVQIPPELRNYSYFDLNNNIYFKTSENECTLKYSNSSNKEDKAAYARIKAFIQLRDCTRDLLTAQEQDKPDSEIEALQAKLNTLYDSFNKKYKLLHSRTNKSMLKDDISYSLVAALEKKIENNKLIEKSDLFTKRTIKPAKVVSHVDTALEALMLSIAEKAKVDFAYMEKLTDMPRTALIDELHGEIYPVPGTDEYQSASEYLSGDIKVKLTEAEIALNNGDSRMKDNIEALKGAMPEPLKAGDIDIKIGATWIDKKYYQQFIYETFDTPYYHRENGKKGIWQRKLKDITVDYSPYSCEWEICNSSADKSVKVTKEFGTAKMNAYDIMENLLNLKDPKINKKVYVDGKKKYVIDPEATKLAQRKAEKIKAAWNDWIFKDLERRAELVQRYNDLFNSIRPREYDGSHLRFPGMNSEIQLHSHQKNAVAHSLFGGNTLFAHCVGAGKTYEMIASAMESKRLGLCTKSLFAVPNHLTEQIGSDFRKLYPNSNILVATNADFNKDNRQALFSKIAAGNFDAVIIGHSQLSMLKMSQERQEKILNTQINDIVKGIQDLKNSEGSNFQVKAMERTKKSLEKRLESLKKENQDDVITFEQLGIDKLYVDEAHEFKNLFTPTKLQNVSGISSSASQKALDLFMKCQYLNEKTGGKGIVFATGTPLSNSVTELHTMMRYLEYDFLKSKNLQHFDNWVTVFGEQKTDWELAPAGNKFKQRTRIANYTGLPELISMYKQVADVRTADTLDLDVPECEMHIVNVEATDFQKELVQELADRADDVQDGKVDPTEDNMLRITSDGRKLGLDPRLINPDFEDNENTKLNQCVNNVFKIYQDTKEDKLTQIVFCDLGVPHSDKSKAKNKKSIENIADTDDDNKSVAEKESLEEECDFCVYDDIKSKLMAKGVPENEIAFIHSAKTEKAKSELFEKVRSGEVRVLLGSTGKMGTGTNVQDKLIAIHDLDIPWRPADMEQRKGRIVRQGNQNEKVHVYRYVTKGTFDAYSYQTLENKQKFISQIQTSNAPVRKCEDVDQQALNYSEIKALCTGDERIKEKMSLDNEVKELKLLKAEYTNTKYEMEDKIKSFAAVEQRMNHTIDNLKTDLEHCKNLPIDPETNLPKFAIEIKNVTYTDRTEAAKALESACVNMIGNVGEAITIGSFHGFPLSVEYSGLENGIVAKLHGSAVHRSDFSISFSNNLKRLESSIFNIEQKIDNVNTELQKKSLM